MQFTNVVMGGTLIQDIPSLIGETVVHKKAYHQVSIDPDSQLAGMLGSQKAMVYFKNRTINIPVFSNQGSNNQKQ